jgi:hypothetical protein
VTRTPGRSGIAAAVLVTAAAVLLGGCGSSGGGAGHPAATAARTSPNSTAPGGSSASAEGSGGSGGSDPAEAPGSAANAPKVPDAQLTPPGGGTFTKKQKAYLSGRVPKGTDPVAVLEGGQEVCERLTRTSAIDPDASASAVVTGDISLSGATAAVRALCPDQQYVLDAARHGFADGALTVAASAVPGTSVAPGRYHAPHPSATCRWRVAGPRGATLASGAAHTAAKAVMTVPAAARSVTSTGCYAWLPPLTKPAPQPAKSTKPAKSTNPSS